MNMINEEKIIELVNKYDDCIIEEIFENHKVMNNWCIITCDLEEIEEDVMIGGIFDLLDDLEKFDNITNLDDETFEDDDGGYYEYVSFEWTL